MDQRKQSILVPVLNSYQKWEILSSFIWIKKIWRKYSHPHSSLLFSPSPPPGAWWRASILPRRFNLFISFAPQVIESPFAYIYVCISVYVLYVYINVVYIYEYIYIHIGNFLFFGLEALLCLFSFGNGMDPVDEKFCFLWIWIEFGLMRLSNNRTVLYVRLGFTVVKNRLYDYSWVSFHWIIET